MGDPLDPLAEDDSDVEALDEDEDFEDDDVDVEELDGHLLGNAAPQGGGPSKRGRKRGRGAAAGTPSSSPLPPIKRGPGRPRKDRAFGVIAGGYIYKKDLERPELVRMIGEANKLFLDGDLGACKEKLRLITIEMGGGIVDRDVYHLLSNVHAAEGNNEKAVLARYHMLMRLGGRTAAEFHQLIKDLATHLPDRPSLRLYLCKKAIWQRFKDSSFFKSLGDELAASGELLEALTKGYVPCLREKLARRPKVDVEDAAMDAAQVCFRLKRWDDLLSTLNLSIQRSRELAGKVRDSTLVLFAQVLCLHTRDFRRCAELYFSAWGLGRTGVDAKQDSIPLIPTRVRQIFNGRDMAVLSWLAVALIQLGRHDEVDETVSYTKGSADAEAMICCQAINSIQDRLDPYADKTDETDAHLALAHHLVDALLEQQKPAPAKRILNKFVVANVGNKLHAETRYRLGECFFQEGDYDKAAEYLEPLIGNDEYTGDQTALRLHLAELYVLKKDKTGFSKILESVNYAHLKSLKRLPPAQSRTERDTMFRELREDLKVTYEQWQEREKIAVEGEGGAVPKKIAGGEKIAEGKEDQLVALPDSFVSKFSFLIYDCELDFDRATHVKAHDDSGNAEEAIPDAPSKKRRRVRQEGRRQYVSIQAKKKALALQNIEDIYSTAVWYDFVRFGCEFAVNFMANQPVIAVELLETVISNRRAHASRAKETLLGLPRLERASFALSLKANMTKIA